MKEEIIIVRTCPRCGRTYSGHPVLSKADIETMICPDCGTREALESIGVSWEEQDEILRVMHKAEGPNIN